LHKGDSVIGTNFLHDMSQFMGNESIAQQGSRLVLARAKGHMLPHGEGASIELAGQAGRIAVRVHTHMAKANAKGRFHP